MYGGYDGSASQFAGQGGFLPTPAGGATAGADGAAGGARGQGRAESLVPLTVKQLETSINASGVDDPFKVNGEEVHNLTLLGKIVGVKVEATKQEYTIDDGTGVVNVKLWLDAEDASVAGGGVEVGQYVRVYGHIRVFQGTRSVIAFNLRPVTDFNEITYHFLEVVYCNSHNGVRAAAAPKDAAAAAQGPAGDNAFAAPGATLAVAAGAAGGSCLDSVNAIFNGPLGGDANGVNVQTAIAALNGRFNDEQVRQAVESLVNDGHLYSTIDDAHFRSTLL